MRRLLLISALCALIFSGAASAATIQDLQALGYTVSVANPGPSGQNCPTYVLSGHGVTNFYFNCNTPQADLDAFANPIVICNADWQTNHPDQFAAYNSLTRKGWAISGDQCADSYQVTNPNTGATAYSGPGVGLTSFDGANATPPAVGNAPTSPVTPSNCLPLCPNPGDTRGGPSGNTITPAAQAHPSDSNATPADPPPYESPVRIGALLYV